MKVIIAGGGTGGHIFPAVAIARALQRLQPGTELLFVGAIGKMEMEKIPQAGFKIIGLNIDGFNRNNLWKNISLPFKLIKSRIKANKIIGEFKPDVVVGVGGYASFPILNAAQNKGIPTLIQEQNSFAGKSNKILGKSASAVCVAYEDMDRFFPEEKIMITGNPVRAEIAQSAVTRNEGIEAFGLNGQKRTLLVIGGSLGARSVNQAIKASLPEIDAQGLQMIWQTGKLFFDEAKVAAAAYDNKMIVKDFLKNMEYAYAAADIVISRAGALASAELCIAGKPVIFVPFPFAAEDHQTSNAMALVEQNAAMMVKDIDASTDLITKLVTLNKDENMQAVMSLEIKKMAVTDADERIARKIMELGVKN
jgi:UDP-N-acetylglucosamine--N-acetylmuramyl-(pentapeptide) pyrophosphoryl-undecaprenol N-acetylglucosamine transferase